MKIPPLTEEQKSEVREYFKWKTLEDLKKDKWNPWIWFRYGRMRHFGEKIPVAEEYKEDIKKRKQNNYRFFKENEMKEKLDEYNIKSWNIGNKFEVVNYHHRETWRTLEIGILDGIKENWDTRRKQTIEIEESQNPEYFQEILKRYNLLD